MRRSVKTLGLSAALAAAALLPLYGDPRGGPVSHAEWAFMVHRAMGLGDSGAGIADRASYVFTTLSGRGSRSWRADLFVRGDGVDVVSDAGGRRVLATAAVGEVAYPLAVARGGDYRVRVRLAGSAPAEAELVPLGERKPLTTFSITPPAVSGWIDAGTAHLDPGAYSAALLLPQGSLLDHVEVAPPCINPIEPRDGWTAEAVATTDDVARTVVQAADLEAELPPAASPIDWRGSDLKVEEGPQALLATLSPLEQEALRAGPLGTKAVLLAELPEPGLYTLSVFSEIGGGQSWLADNCRKAVLCPRQEQAAAWHVVLSGEFAAGLHSFSVTLGPGAVLHRLRLERKKDAPADYLAALERLGLALGPEGPVTREKAVEAERFLQRRVRAGLALCGDVVLPGEGAVRSALAEPAPPVAGPGVVPPGAGTGPAPLAPPAVPPQQVPSPTLPVGFQ